MKVRDYSSINKSTKSNFRNFKIALKQLYPDIEEINLSNEQGNKYMISQSYIHEWEENFKKITDEAISRREVNVSDYLYGGYVVSEINSSLKAEGVHSSWKIVEQIIKDNNEGIKRSRNEIETLISNYYESIRFIIKKPEINMNNIYTLYRLMTVGVKNNIIEELSFYRQKDVYIGNDKGIQPSLINESMKELITFINDNENFPFSVHTKAIIAHYIFENIHPYYDFNGRMGRLLHLWILINDSVASFWELIYLSEAIFAYKSQFDKIFSHIYKAKKNEANIDLNYFIGSMYEILIKHSKAYIEMKNYVSKMKKSPTRMIRLFIIDMITIDPTHVRWFSMLDFRKSYPDYSSAMYGKILQEICESNIFNIQQGKPIKFRLKNN